jgi:hypothetical protein
MLRRPVQQRVDSWVAGGWLVPGRGAGGKQRLHGSGVVAVVGAVVICAPDGAVQRVGARAPRLAVNACSR